MIQIVRRTEQQAVELERRLESCITDINNRVQACIRSLDARFEACIDSLNARCEMCINNLNSRAEAHLTEPTPNNGIGAGWQIGLFDELDAQVQASRDIIKTTILDASGDGAVMVSPEYLAFEFDGRTSSS